MDPFTASGANTVNIDVSAASQSVQVQPQANAGTYQVLVVNNGTATVWIAFGGSGVTASLATGIPVPAGAGWRFTTSGAYVAAIAAAATGKIYFAPGSGN